MSRPCSLTQSREYSTMKNILLFVVVIILAALASLWLFPAHKTTTPVQAATSTLKASNVHNVKSRDMTARAYDVLGKPTITPAYINRALCSANSPACGTGQALYDYGVRAGIDPAFALAFFHHESSYGRYGIAHDNQGLGNIRCTPGYVCKSGFRAYASWEEGYKDWYDLITYYVNTLNKRTIPDIVRTYAPSVENDTLGYIRSVEQDIDAMRGSK